MTTNIPVELNSVELMLRKHHSNVFRICSKADMETFLAMPAKIKLLFLYMPGCGPCHRTAPELARLFISKSDLAIACMSSEHYAWLMEPQAVLTFKAGRPEGFPHIELYVGRKPVGELENRAAESMKKELVQKFPELNGKIRVFSVVNPVRVGGGPGVFSELISGHAPSNANDERRFSEFKNGYYAYARATKANVKAKHSVETTTTTTKRTGGSSFAGSVSLAFVPSQIKLLSALF